MGSRRFKRPVTEVNRRRTVLKIGACVAFVGLVIFVGGFSWILRKQWQVYEHRSAYVNAIFVIQSVDGHEAVGKRGTAQWTAKGTINGVVEEVDLLHHCRLGECSSEDRVRALFAPGTEIPVLYDAVAAPGLLGTPSRRVLSGRRYDLDNIGRQTLLRTLGWASVLIVGLGGLIGSAFVSPSRPSRDVRVLGQ